MSDLVDRVINAMKAADPNCADRHPDDLCDLAAVVIEAVRAYDLEHPEPDQQTEQCSEELHDPFAGAGLWVLF